VEKKEKMPKEAYDEGILHKQLPHNEQHPNATSLAENN
jgi:hypothetical protein